MLHRNVDIYLKNPHCISENKANFDIFTAVRNSKSYENKYITSGFVDSRSAKMRVVERNGRKPLNIYFA